jgi:hypothetical protein
LRDREASTEDKIYVKDLIEKGQLSIGPRGKSKYSEVLFNSGTPFVGDSLPEFMPVNQPIVSSITIVSASELERG